MWNSKRVIFVSISNILLVAQRSRLHVSDLLGLFGRCNF